MKKMYKLAIPLMGSILFTSTAMSQVENISGDSLVQYGKEDAYWVSEVTCADESKRVVQHKTDGELWCGKTVKGFCDETKESAAIKVCGSQYSQALSQIQATKQARNNAVKAEQRAKDQQAERERAQQRRAADERIVQQRIEREKRAAAAEPIRKQINIEEELILIEQEKLELRRQELELQRRAAEIEAKLKTES